MIFTPPYFWSETLLEFDKHNVSVNPKAIGSEILGYLPGAIISMVSLGFLLHS